MHYLIAGLQTGLQWPPPWLFILVVAALALLTLGWRRAEGWGLAVFTLLGLGLVWNLGYWDALIKTLALVLAAEALVLLIGVPLRILSAKSRLAERMLRRLLDIMQTCRPLSTWSQQ